MKSTRIVNLLAAVLSATGLMAASVEAGSQDNAVVAMHIRTLTSKQASLPCSFAPTIPCSQYTVNWAGGTAGWAYLMVAKGDPVAGVAGLSCGVQYNQADLYVDWRLCADIEMTGLNVAWPLPGSGNRMSWNNVTSCQTTVYGSDGVHAVFGAFYVYAYAPTTLEIVPHPDLLSGPELKVADCAGAESDVLYPAHVGKIGFGGQAGFVPCCPACVDLSMAGAAACVGDTVQVPVTLVNCAAEAEDFLLECSVGGVPASPLSFPAVGAGDTVITPLQVVCASPGNVLVECLVTAVLVSDSTCTVQDSAQVIVTCGEACVTVAMVPGPDACLGDSVTVDVTLTNCSADSSDLMAVCTVGGVPGTPMNFPGVSGFETKMFTLAAACTTGGAVEFICAATATSLSNSACISMAADTAYAQCLNPAPVIFSILDVTNDQGRRVRLRWTGSCHDQPGGSPAVIEYGIWRRIDPLPVLAGPGRVGQRLPGLTYPPGDWDFVSTVPARGEAQYSTVVETLCDSTITAGLCRSVFFVSARTQDPLVYFDSAPDSGYSVDNLSPAAPMGLQFLAPASLTWDEAPEADFDHYMVYGSSTSLFDETATLIGSTTDTGMNVQLASYAYYHVTAVDYNGNEGDASSALNTVAVPEPGFIPASYALYQSRPNPFTSATRITFDLPEAGHVRIRVFDVQGRPVRILVDSSMAAGRYTIAWQGRDDSGRPAAPGIYLYVFETPRFRDTQKAILIR